MKDIKYIIKRIVIGVGIFIAIYFLKTNVFAYTITTVNGVDIDESYIYDKLVNYNNDFDLNTYPYISVSRLPNANRLFIVAFSSFDDFFFSATYNTSSYSNLYFVANRQNDGTSQWPSVYCISYNYSTNTYDNSGNYVPYCNHGMGASYLDIIVLAQTNFRSTSVSLYHYTNFSADSSMFVSPDNSSSYNAYQSLVSNIPTLTRFNTLDFSSFLSTTYMSLTTLDSSNTIIDTINCIDNTDDYCSITPTQDTRYLRVSYNVPEFIGNELDILNNQIMQSNTKLISINPYISAKQVYLEYYYGGSTSNVASNMYFVNGSNSYNVSNQLYNFISSFKQNDDYSSVSLYRFDIYYDLGGVYYNSDLLVPYYLTFKTITSGGSGTTDNTNEEQQQQQIDQNQVIIDNLDDINNSINNSNTTDSSNSASNFFNNFTSNDFGLSSIITIPLQAINSISTSSCSALNVPVPFTNGSISLPCMTQVYQENVPQLFALWQIVSFGIISYFIGVDIFHIVKGFKEPDSDKVEVLDL